MKKLVLALLLVCSASSLAFAQEAVTTTTEKTVTLKGYLIDNMCAQAHKDNLAEFVTIHTKKCALSSPCVESGYSIFADGTLYKLDMDSIPKVVEFLNREDSKLYVVVIGKDVNGELSLVSIANEE